MGGLTFTSASADGQPTLSTPRMSPEIYAQIKSNCIKRIQEFLPGTQVSAHLEAPEKNSYGDLDIIVAHDVPVKIQELARHVGARGLIIYSNNGHQSFSLAIPQDGSRSDQDPIIYKHRLNNGNTTTEENPAPPSTTELFAQVDIEIVRTSNFIWHQFYSSYGDLNILLGHIVHQHGFTLNDKGLFLRLPELDAAKQRNDPAAPHINIDEAMGKLFLTNDPVKVMDFLGLSSDRYYAGFATVDDFCEWLSTSRLISSRTVLEKRNKSSVKKQRLNRSLFRYFLESYLPKNLGVNIDAESVDNGEAVECEKCKHVTFPADRDQDHTHAIERTIALKKAVEVFPVKDQFDFMHNKLTNTINNQEADHILKPILQKYGGTKGKAYSEDKQLKEIVRGFQKFVAVQKCCGEMSMLEEPHEIVESELGRLLDESGVKLKDEKSVDDWVKEHWDEVKRLERQRAKSAKGAKEVTGA
jgi:hypothetical protein